MMKRNRLIFYSVIGALHLLIVIFSFYMDSKREDLEFLFDMQKTIPYLKYCSFVLLILFTTSVILHYRDNKRNLNEKAGLNKELDTLKARLFDLQEGKK